MKISNGIQQMPITPTQRNEASISYELRQCWIHRTAFPAFGSVRLIESSVRLTNWHCTMYMADTWALNSSRSIFASGKIMRFFDFSPNQQWKKACCAAFFIGLNEVRKKNKFFCCEIRFRLIDIGCNVQNVC